MGDGRKGSRRRELTGLGWLIAIAGLLLAAASYILLDLGRFLTELDGLLGLGEWIWLVIGGIVWVFLVMIPVTVLVLMVGTQE